MSEKKERNQSRTEEICGVHMEPTLDRVIVRSIDPESVTKGGIHLPDTAKGRPQKGIVLAVGPGKVSDSGSVHALPFRCGDMVLYSRYAGNEVDKDDFPGLLILSEHDILAIIHGA